LASISANELAQQVVETCLADHTWPQRALDALLERALGRDPIEASDASRTFFSVVVERLADLFEPALCDVYCRLFTHVIARAMPQFNASDLAHRYRRIAQVRRYGGGDVDRVYVLSRITLGADIAVTSVMLDGMKRRFPEAEICFVGPSKNAELFLDDARILPISVQYGRSALLLDRLIAARELEDILTDPASLVVDPDSRLTQLGLIPVCDDARYFFFESRAYGGVSLDPLPRLANQWLLETFGVEGQPFLAPERLEAEDSEFDEEEHDEADDPRRAEPRASQLPATGATAAITVNLGVGENQEKRLGDEFEQRVLSRLAAFDRPILIDRGAGPEEGARIDRHVARLIAQTGKPHLIQTHDGPFASFARHIIESRLYFGFDSAGQHAAAAAGVPLVSVFAGYVSDRMFARWRPTGLGHIGVVKVASVDDPAAVWERTEAAITAAAAAQDWPAADQ
jgi:ADP-heptose:LPS heptosyltransferase